MTFDEYSDKYLQALTDEARRLVQMGWNARGSHGNYQGILDSSACEVPEGLDATQEEWARINGRKHIAEARKMVKGDVSTAGSVILLEGKTYERAIVVAFESDNDLRAAIAAGQCRFTVFGGEV